ncbi:MAG: hypothetical protein AAGI66_04750 [Cyanobacteria bacterium P01_H01_bin.74]
MIQITILLTFIANSGTSFAAVLYRPYIHPDALKQSELTEKIEIERPVDINVASLAELMTLPAFDASLALKLMRSRPVSSLEDLYRKMPVLDSPVFDSMILPKQIEFSQTERLIK